MKEIIFLTGMPGAGKTSWGKKLSEAHRIPWYDLDSFMVIRYGASVASLFDNYGENGFRIKESKCLRDMIRTQTAPFILSCGGGLTLDPANLALMKEKGHVVYLKAEISTLLKNLENGLTHRPLLAGAEDPAARIKELYEQRKDIYEQADVTLSVESLRVSDFDQMISECIEQH